MLELHILNWLMRLEGESSQTGGKLMGYSVTFIGKELGVPKATFYRSLRVLVESGMVQKQGRNKYILSNEFRELSNRVKDNEKVRS